jgi:phage baseplate assembly protein W
MEDTRDFIGRGWRFPIHFSQESGGVTMTIGEDDIQNSLAILFATRMGERIMHPDFGSELEEFLFSGINQSLITYMQAVISNAILFNEPRIIVNDVIIEQALDAEMQLMITIHYTVSATNNRYNYVFPFYLKEGTNLNKYGQ